MRRIIKVTLRLAALVSGALFLTWAPLGIMLIRDGKYLAAGPLLFFAFAQILCCIGAIVTLIILARQDRVARTSSIAAEKTSPQLLSAEEATAPSANIALAAVTEPSEISCEPAASAADPIAPAVVVLEAADIDAADVVTAEESVDVTSHTVDFTYPSATSPSIESLETTAPLDDDQVVSTIAEPSDEQQSASSEAFVDHEAVASDKFEPLVIAIRQDSPNSDIFDQDLEDSDESAPTGDELESDPSLVLDDHDLVLAPAFTFLPQAEQTFIAEDTDIDPAASDFPISDSTEAPMIEANDHDEADAEVFADSGAEPELTQTAAVIALPVELVENPTEPDDAIEQELPTQDLAMESAVDDDFVEQQSSTVEEPAQIAIAESLDFVVASTASVPMAESALELPQLELVPEAPESDLESNPLTESSRVDHEEAEITVDIAPQTISELPVELVLLESAELASSAAEQDVACTESPTIEGEEVESIESLTIDAQPTESHTAKAEPVEAEPVINDQPEQATPARKVRLCGYCRQPGHNRTKCPQLRR